MQTGVDGGRWERLDGTLLNSFRALGTKVGAAATLVTADVQKLTFDATTETAVEDTAGKVL